MQVKEAVEREKRNIKEVPWKWPDTLGFACHFINFSYLESDDKVKDFRLIY